MFDLLIRNGRVIDGTGAPAYEADVGIADGRIAAVGRNLSDAAKVIDAAGRAVTPGFIDIHRHADYAVFRQDFGRLELKQGLTTIVSGNCGLSAAPIAGPFQGEIQDYLRPITGPAGEEVPADSLGAYLDAAERIALPIHIGMLAGAGTIRAAAAGYSKEQIDGNEYERIHRLLLQSVE